jgi:two-component system, OmpR family, sensor histidine kinase VicK
VVKEGVEDCSNPERIKLAPSQEPLIVDADRLRIGEVISNLLSNALRYSRDENVIVLVWREDREAYLSVKDNGAGIDASSMSRLFTKFFTKSDSDLGWGCISPN